MMTTEKSDKKNVDKLIRILATDIEGNKNVYTGLTKIKGVSWGISNALCLKLGIKGSTKIGDLSEGQMAKIVEFIKKPKLPAFMLNRRRNLETGEDLHLQGTDLELRKEFDIKRLKEIRTYRGLRHATGKPVRGQRTRGNFRKNKAVGVAKKSKKGKKT